MNNYYNEELENDGEEDYKSDLRDTLRYLYLNDKNVWLSLWCFMCDEEKTHDAKKIEAAYPEWIEEIIYHILIDFCDSYTGYFPTDAKTLKEIVLKLIKKWAEEDKNKIKEKIMSKLTKEELLKVLEENKDQLCVFDENGSILHLVDSVNFNGPSVQLNLAAEDVESDRAAHAEDMAEIALMEAKGE